MDDLKLEAATPTLSIYQKKGVFSYGTDAVLLAKYVLSYHKSLSGKRMCDLCSGTGIIPLYICDSDKGISAVGVEINHEACTIANMSANVSGLSERYTQIEGDLKAVRDFFKPEEFDFLTCNPPYMTASSGFMCNDDYKTIARHEILCTINDIFSSASYLLRTGGNFFVVYRADRLASLFEAASKNNFQIKELISFVSGNSDSPVKLIVCRASKGSNEGLKHYVFNINDFLS